MISSDCPTEQEILKNGKYGILFNPGDKKDLSSSHELSNHKKYDKIILKIIA